MVTESQKSVIYSDLCFGCGMKNPIGLKLKFKWDGKKVIAEFIPHKFHQGWADIIHGGIIAAVLDEAIAYAAGYEGIKCVTAAMQVRFKHPLTVGEPTTVTASVTKNLQRYVETEARITLADGTLIADCTAKQFVVSETPITKIGEELKKNGKIPGPD
jgi:uncharacterized protein (TIGR00369 family)